MPFPNGRHLTWITIVLSLAAQFPISVIAQQHSSTPQDDSYGEYSPPMTTVLVIVVALFLAVGFLSVYFRHFALCLGVRYGGRRNNGAGGGAWRREAARGGLDASVVESFPTFLYSEVKVHCIGKATLECAVCITEFSEDENLLMLPVCSHVFHPDCISPWLASHVTCPVCRANLEFQHRRNHFETLLQQLHQQYSDGESEPSDQIHQPDHHDAVINVGTSTNNTVVNNTVKSPVQEIKDGGGRRGTLLRSHSTGHSMAGDCEMCRTMTGDCERFTLRLPEELRSKLVTANYPSVLPAMVSPRTGYRARSVGFAVRPDRWRFSASPPCIPGSTWSPIQKTDITTESSNSNLAGIMSGPNKLLKALKSPLNRGVRYTSEIGERSSDKLWPNRRPQDIESDG